MIDNIFYSGAFVKGKKHGIGELTDEDGETKRAIFKNDKLIEELGEDDE